jgi:hypothetical protein
MIRRVSVGKSQGDALAGIRAGGGAGVPISRVGLCGNFQAQSAIDNSLAGAW